MFISPMLLATTPGPFSNSDYIFEPKVDGHRLVFSQKNGVIRLYTRHHIMGYRKEEFGWLTAVLDGSGRLRPTGIIEHGPGPKEKRAFYGVSKGIVSGEDRNFVYIEPLIRAQVKMRNWTKSGMLRDPVFTKFNVK